MKTLGYILAGLFVIIVIIGSIGAFKSCYDDHRNQLGFSKTTSVTACSG